ncbi:alpha/beta fold hydrolase [Streptomyces sp. ML-6]|uniref:thioesterase II family protein n=1 Tax=Streptomyces sp. ML-6 TaxID=2982693 RepID=UPI0024C0254A|nr:alpha/beta fold hydrolase [Streptomyces sp. ML-6]MDK0517995.1 thioesterase domain-containing protein [Streptomyces sp. ML-6]
MNATGASGSAWFNSGTPKGARLYVIPQAGGGAAPVTALRRALEPRLATVAVRLPFRESRLADPLPGSLHSLADTLAEEISAHSGEESFLVLGHCSGALLAYETAARLTGHQGLGGLVVSAQVAPERFAPVRTHTMSPDEFHAYVEQHHLVPPEVLATPPLWEMLRPTLRADLQLYEAYRPSDHVLDVPVLVVHGRQDDRFPPSAAAAWGSRTRNGFHHVVLERDHDYLSSGPGELADALLDSLPRFGPPFLSSS